MSYDVSGFISVHVSGLPDFIDDEAIEAELRAALDKPMGTCGLLAVLDEPSSGTLDELLASLDGPKNEESREDDTEAPAHETAKNEEAAEGGGEAENAVGRALETEEQADVERQEVAAEGVEKPDVERREDVAEGVEKADVERKEDVAKGVENAEEESEATLLSESCYSCSVPRKKTGESKGFCFLEFVTLEAAEAAIRLFNSGVQISGSVVSAQLAKQNAATTSEQADQYNKSKKKTAKSHKDEAFYMPQMQIKSRDQGYNKGLNSLAPPLRKKNPRPLGAEKKATTYIKAMTQTKVVETPEALLSLKDGEKQLALKNKKKNAQSSVDDANQSDLLEEKL